MFGATKKVFPSANLIKLYYLFIGSQAVGESIPNREPVFAGVERPSMSRSGDTEFARSAAFCKLAAGNFANYV